MSAPSTAMYVPKAAPPKAAKTVRVQGSLTRKRGMTPAPAMSGAIIVKGLRRLTLSDHGPVMTSRMTAVTARTAEFMAMSFPAAARVIPISSVAM